MRQGERDKERAIDRERETGRGKQGERNRKKETGRGIQGEGDRGTGRPGYRKRET